MRANDYTTVKTLSEEQFSKIVKHFQDGPLSQGGSVSLNQTKTNQNKTK